MLSEFNGKNPKIHETAYIADSAELIGEVTIGEETRKLINILIGTNSKLREAATKLKDNSAYHGNVSQDTIIVDSDSIDGNPVSVNIIDPDPKSYTATNYTHQKDYRDITDIIDKNNRIRDKYLRKFGL